jgi:hypothetical protein
MHKMEIFRESRSISEFWRSRCESVATWAKECEMSKPDLKGKNNEDYPTVRIRFECDRRVTVLSHTLTLSVTNLLEKQTHDD